MKKVKEEINSEELNHVIKKSKKLLDLLYLVIICVIVLSITILIREWGIVSFIGNFLKVISPLFIGFVIAWLLNPIVKRLNEMGVNRALASVLTLLLFVFLIFLFLSFLIPTLYEQINDLIKVIPSIIEEVQDLVNKFFNSLSSIEALDVQSIRENAFASIEDVIHNFTTSIPNLLISFIGNIFSKIGTIAIGIMVGLYMLIDFDSFNTHLLKLVPKKYKFEVKSLMDKIATELHKYVNGTLLIAFIVFTASSLGFAIVGLKAPVLFGVFCGITDLIPYVGPYIGGAAAVVVGFSQGTLTGFLSLIVVVLVQGLESMIIQPLLMSKKLKIHPATIILGLLVFGHFFGIIGMVLATPAVALIKIVYQFFAEKYGWFGTDY